MSMLTQKLKIKNGMRLTSLHEPDHFKTTIGKLPDGTKWVKWKESADQLHWFVSNQKELKKDLKQVLGQLQAESILWIYYPKGSSGIQTDLTRDHGWDVLMVPENGLTWLSLVAFDNTWSAFAMRKTTAKDLAAAKKKKEAPVAAGTEYIDREKRTVQLPPDLAKALKPWPAARRFFEAMPFTHKREYVEWIISAKKEETRQVRIEKTVENMKAEQKMFR